MSVCILDSHVALAEALAVALAVEEGVASARAARDPQTAAAIVDAGLVDVLVVALDSDSWNGEQLLRRVGQRGHDVALVAMSGDDDPDRVASAILAGASSWVPKQAHVRQFAAAVIGAAAGESSIPPLMLRQVLRRLSAGRPPVVPTGRFATLSDREREVLHHAANGLSRAEIADQLGVSLNTVRTHLQRIMKKLGVTTTLEAVTQVLHERAGTSRTASL